MKLNPFQIYVDGQGSILEMGSAVVGVQWFGYTSEVTVAQGASASDNISLDSDADFWLSKITYFADIAAAAQTDSSRVIPLCTLQITNTGSNRRQFDDAVPIPSIAGTGELPHLLPVAVPYPRSSVIQLSYENFDAAADYNIKMLFEGYKVFTQGETLEPGGAYR